MSFESPINEEQTVESIDRNRSALDQQETAIIEEKRKIGDHSLLRAGKRWLTLALLGTTLVGAGCKKETAQSANKDQGIENVKPEGEDWFDRMERKMDQKFSEKDSVKDFIKNKGFEIDSDTKIEISKEQGLITSIKLNGAELPLSPQEAEDLKKAEDDSKLENWKNAHPVTEDADTSATENSEPEEGGTFISPEAADFLR